MPNDAQSYIDRMLAFVGDDDPMAILADTPLRLTDLIAGADDVLCGWRPEPSRWSINEIAAHMADAELVAGYRIRMILASDGVAIQAFDQDAWASRFRYETTNAAESARLFAALRTGTLRLLERVDPALLDNHGMHAERGRETVRHLIRFFAGHDRNHLQQIERILVARPAG